MPSDLLEIVVIEDDPGMSRAIERMLRFGDFKPIMFGSAEASLEAGVLLTADCLILDIQLPGMSGFDLFEYLLPNGGSPPTIFITSFDRPAFRDKAGRLHEKIAVSTNRPSSLTNFAFSPGEFR